MNYALGMTINFYYPTLKLFCFSFTQPFARSKFCLPNPFLFGPTPTINNDPSLSSYHINSPYELNTITRNLFCLYNSRRPGTGDVITDEQLEKLYVQVNQFALVRVGERVLLYKYVYHSTSYPGSFLLGRKDPGRRWSRDLLKSSRFLISNPR